MKVFITGGTRGLGKEIAQIFAKNNAEIYLNYYENDKEAINTKRFLEQTYHCQINLLKGDISKEETIKEFTKILTNLDVLICNAGIDKPSSIPEKTIQSFKRIIDVNLTANFLLTQYLGLQMEKQQKGCIIYINSDNALDKFDSVTLEYDVSKSGLLMLAKDYAKYFKYVKIHTIMPGWLNTDMNNLTADIKQMISFVDIKKVAQKVYEEVKNKQTGNVEVIR